MAKNNNIIFQQKIQVKEPTIILKLPKEVKVGEEIEIQIHKKSYSNENPKLKLTDFLGVFKKYDNQKSYEDLKYEYLKDKYNLWN